MSKARPARRGLLGRFRRDRDGATAVEFAMIAVPFFGLLMAIFETALLMWATQVLDTLVADAARQIYTGTFQNGNRNTTDPVELKKRFKELVCMMPDPKDATKKVPRMTLFDCQGLLQVDIRKATAFSDTAPGMVKNGDFDPASFGYQEVPAGEIALVRAAIGWPLHMSLATGVNYALSGNRKLLVATAAFMTEPYGSTSAKP